MTVGTRMQQRRATEAVWTTSDYVLAAGELGVTTDTGIVKIGNGTSPWSELAIAFGSQYLPILGKAADSELLDGVDSTGFYKLADATTAATANKLVKRLSDGRAQALTAVSGDDLVNYTQWATANASTAASIVDSRKELIARTLSDATTTFTLAATDVNSMVMAANSSLTTQRLVTIPTNASVAITIGSWIDVCSTDEGNLKLSPAGGVTLNGKPHIFGGYSVMRIIKTATDTWVSVPMGSRRGRTPKIRVYKTVATTYAGGTQLVPYNTVDSTIDFFNPDNEWFSIPAAGLATAKRVLVNKDGEYLITVNFITTPTTQTAIQTFKVVTDNSLVGSRLLMNQPVWTTANSCIRVRLSAGDGIGTGYNNSGSTDHEDGFFDNRNDLAITRIGD